MKTVFDSHKFATLGVAFDSAEAHAEKSRE
jgi:hypothetical protein